MVTNDATVQGGRRCLFRVVARALNRDISVSRTSWHKGVILGRNSVCVFITAGPITKLFAGGGGGEWTTCAMIDDEPRPVWMSPLVTQCIWGVCVFITAGPITKLFAGGGGGEWTTCAMIDDEPRPVWMSPLVTHGVFVCVYWVFRL